MYRHAPPVLESAPWLEVSAQWPCPICGGTAGCRVSPTGELVGCLTRPSERPLVTGGWLHAAGALA